MEILGEADDILFGMWWHPQWILVGDFSCYRPQVEDGCLG
jgi:hypothetical protein